MMAVGRGRPRHASSPRPKRSLGQNFLVDPNTQRAIVAALDPHPRDTVVEVGPGRGALTAHLAGVVDRLIAIELDERLAEALAREHADDPSVEIVPGDFLECTRARFGLAAGAFKLIGNLPYNRTSPMIFHILSDAWRPACAVVMVQREVADRVLAAAGSKAYGALSVGVGTRADAEAALRVSRRAFRPVPDVESTVLRLRPHDPPRLREDEERALRTLTRVAFARRRKQFQRILRDAPEFALDAEDVEALERELGVDLTARPETFPPGTFVAMSRALGLIGGTP
jgi:16S rRNA (adenine1518-N6/adenine1519-N6)-dimethyltransferase